MSRLSLRIYLAFLAVVGALEDLSALLAVVVPALAVLWLVVVSDARALSRTGASGPAVAWLGLHRRHLLAAGLQLVFWVGGLGYLSLRQWKRFAITFVAVGVLVAAQSVATADQAVWVATFLGPAVFTVQAASAMDAWRLADAGVSPA